jgi:hypothetical protein
VRDETVTTRRTEDRTLGLRWNTLAGWHIDGVGGLPDNGEWKGEPIEYVRAEQARVLAEFAEWIRRDQSHPCPVDRERVDAAITAIRER